MLVNIENEVALEMLVDRVKFWTDDEDIIELYRRMYENYIDNGVFDGSDFDINVIVDNDYVNYCDVISPGEDNYNNIKELAADGEYDISCEYDKNGGYSFIEAEYNGYYLLRC